MNFTEKQKQLYESAKKDIQTYTANGYFAKLDMHIHSTMSDGTFSIPQIICMAKEFGLESIFITDHNTCLPGYQLLTSISEEFLNGIEVYVGCEIATKIEDPVTGKFIPIEVLSYYANPYKIHSFLDKYEFSKKASQSEQLKLLLATCDRLGLKHSNNLVIPDGCFATEILCKDLILYEENKPYFMENAPLAWTSPKLFYKTCVSNPDSDFYIDTTEGLPYYKDTIHAIVDAGGIAIGAHMFLYSRNSQKEVEQLMTKLVSTTKISGFEAYHSSHTQEQRHFIVNYANKNNLLYTGGTDFHSGPQTILGYGQKTCPVAIEKSCVNFFQKLPKNILKL